MKMNALNVFGGIPCGVRKGLIVLASTVVLAGGAMAEDKPLDAAPLGAKDKPLRVSPYVQAAQRRAQEEGEAAQPRIGLQAQMQKNALRRHHAPAQPGA